MHRSIFRSAGLIYAMSSIAFAAADKAGSGAAPAPSPIPSPIPVPTEAVAASPAPSPIPAPSPVPAPAAVVGDGTSAVAAAAPVPEFKLFGIIDGIPLPPKKSGGRAGQTLYDFDKLEIGQSFGCAGKTAKGMASTVSSANARFIEKEADGKTPKKDAAGKVIQTRKFVASAVDPKTDPQGAEVRVWRVPLNWGE